MDNNLLELNLDQDVVNEFKRKDGRDRLVINLGNGDERFSLTSEAHENKIGLLLVKLGDFFRKNSINMNELGEPVKILLVNLISNTISEQVSSNNSIFGNIENVVDSITKILSNELKKEIISIRSLSSPQDGDSGYTYKIGIEGNNDNIVIPINLEDLKKIS